MAFLKFYKTFVKKRWDYSSLCTKIFKNNRTLRAYICNYEIKTLHLQ